MKSQKFEIYSLIALGSIFIGLEFTKDFNKNVEFGVGYKFSY